MGITQTLVTYFRNTLTGLRPVRELCIAFGITWYLIYKLPVSDEAKAKSKFLHPDQDH